MPTPTANGTPSTFFEPRDNESLWKLVTTPHPLVGKARHLGEALVNAEMVAPATLMAGLRAQQGEREQGIKRLIGQILVEQGHLSQDQLREAIASWLGEYVVHPEHLQPDATALALVPRGVAERESVLPLLAREDALVVLMADPYDRTLLDELRFLTQRRLIPLQAAPGTLLPAIAKAYSVHPASPTASAPPAAAGRAGNGPHAPSAARASSQELVVNLSSSTPESEAAQADVVTESDNTLVRLINSIIDEAIAHRASDIHIETEPAPQNVRVRLRIDGDLVPYLELPARFRYAMVARIKIMATMDISEHRKPQDGKIDFSRFGGPPVELRVVTVPTSRGLEDVVLRLLAGAKPLPLDSIGLNPANLISMREVVQKSYGLVLVVGPTGCGKTTTLHSVISDINTAGRKIWTAEDPIEITQSGLRQVQVNPRIGWTFAAAMRTFLRADPDVIMIGEMRDEETARIAIEASLTGHLVLSTLHTNSAPESVARLLEIGLDPFNFSDSLLAILAQRLVRRLCTGCREPWMADEDTLQAMAAQYLESSSSNTHEARTVQVERWRSSFGNETGDITLWRHKGCSQCEQHGYRGRMGIHELMMSSEAIRQHIRHRASATEIRLTALAAGMLTLRQDGIEKVLQGLTDMSEVIAATNL
ncbi:MULTISPECIES: GspE/PulE family protein [unclassified Simplicispira]|uniref:GspE/PulE family protein n=1 Tax=unclassified Simplicispira TaxID=2630407 RepID=UPI000D5E40ED|nr:MULTISPECIES: GspE/PulE family protein [unclassified Simplicispira]MBH1977334.1 Flp pilus assembly complex ATPase component TadA [Comamonadaceae bacterium]PVY57533.1 type II secretory ATPase GspE/PulE/Tfp pilus assembly ATPase PilB-like protein [Simplicispira sp. 125]REG18477.1 type II secretory ATPase GspE/PulE/Tfp pilus assembly ATPase PilB-like protein [Simplicispira sp. 110]